MAEVEIPVSPYDSSFMMSAVETTSISIPFTEAGMLRFRIPRSQAFRMTPQGKLCSLSQDITWGRISFLTKRLTVST
jgi:hypothetical protein